MRCPNCKEAIIPLRVGATIGGCQLRACPVCGVVFIELDEVGKEV